MFVEGWGLSELPPRDILKLISETLLVTGNTARLVNLLWLNPPDNSAKINPKTTNKSPETSLYPLITPRCTYWCWKSVIVHAVNRVKSVGNFELISVHCTTITKPGRPPVEKCDIRFCQTTSLHYWSSYCWFSCRIPLLLAIVGLATQQDLLQSA